jgi:hypothetical protein
MGIIRVLLAIAAVVGAIEVVGAEPRDQFACYQFTRDIEGDWIAKRDVDIDRSGAQRPVHVEAGDPLPEDLQDRVEDHCSSTKASAG